MTTNQTVVAELRELAKVYVPVRNRLLEMAAKLEWQSSDDERLKWEALGIVAVCAECGHRVRPNDSCDLCRPPFDSLPRYDRR